MSKVGIMTWYKYQNYGTALQAYAMSRAVMRQGFDPVFINYRPRKAIEDIVSLKVIWQKVKVTVNHKLNPPFCSTERTHLYEQFISVHLKETKPCNTQPELNALNNDFAAFVCGSDQIWAPSIFDEKYFLSFVKSNEKKIAYAPSIGLPDIENGHIQRKIGELVQQFSHLSVRERQGAQLLEKYYGLKSEVVLDPTLLLTSSEWDVLLSKELVSKSENLGNYILCYFLNNEKRYIKDVEKIARKIGAKIVSIPVQKNSKLNKVPFEIGPLEFLALTRAASYVCTDSFHGIAFSINYNIPFSAFLRFDETDKNNQNSRITSLLSLLCMENRIVSNSNNVSVSCDFSKANERLAKLRINSERYMSDALKTATKSSNNVIFDYKVSDICCGCGICAKECSQNAISFVLTKEGFHSHVIDKRKCIGCLSCQSVCPYQNVSAKDLRQVDELYSLKSCDSSVLKRSSSGGASYYLNLTAIKKGMTAYGAVYQSDRDEVEHKAALDEEAIQMFQGSKYIQSKTAAAFASIDSVIEKTNIIFTGTPCQVAALNNWLSCHNQRGKAILVDFICHGVPSRLLWKKYLFQTTEKAHMSRHPQVYFRNKENGDWRRLKLSLTDSERGRKYIASEQKDDFYAFFRRSICNMYSCYECPYRDKSAADIRIADYWGSKFKNDKTGVSMVIAVNKKGNAFLQELKDANCVDLIRQDMEDFWTTQYPYNMPLPLYYDDLLRDLRNTDTDLEALRQHYCSGFDKQEALVNILAFFKRHK